MKNIKAILIASSLFLCGCGQQDDWCAPSDQVGLIGNEWLLYETGHSPGAGYVTTEVPTDPAKKIKFHEDGTLTHTMEGWNDYQFYLILDDPQSDQDILSLYKTDPGDDPQDIYHLEQSYGISIDGCTLKLHYRWCIEGCHLGFKRITN